MLPPTENPNPIAASSPIQDVVHWAYLVGGSPDVFRDMRRHLIKAGINVCGHLRMEARGRDVKIPRSATVVLAATDASNHSATDAAREQARKRGIPCVLTPFRHWSICHVRLTEAGILGNQSIFKSAQRDVTVRKFTALLESTPSVAAAAFKHEVRKPSSEMTAAIREELIDQPEAAKAFGIEPEPPPPPPPSKPAEARPAAPAIPRQDIVPTFRGKDLAERRKPDRTAEKQKARRDFARQLIKDAGGRITNIAVRAEVEKRFGTSITHPVLNHLRIELGYRPHKNGGHESDLLSPSSMRARDSKAPPPPAKAAPPPAVEAKAAPAKPEAKPEAKPSPLVPVVAVPAGPVKGRRRTGKRDALTLIGELQEELRARGIWGVMIEASGTFTFQKEK